MLIVTTNAIPAASDAAAMEGWAEPRVLVVLPASGWTEAELTAIQSRATVIEYLQPRATFSALMGDVQDMMRQTVRPVTGPLLFLDTPPVGDLSIAAQAQAAAGAGVEVVQAPGRPGGGGHYWGGGVPPPPQPVWWRGVQGGIVKLVAEHPQIRS